MWQSEPTNAPSQRRWRQVDHSEHPELSEHDWAEVEPLLPPRSQRGRRGRPCRDHRTLLNGVLWVLRTRAAWRDLPARYGPWQTAYMHFRRWGREGRLREVIERLALDLPERDRWDDEFSDGPLAREYDPTGTKE